MRNLSRLEKRTCLSSTCYRPSMVSNAFPDQSFSPCHHREIICSYIRTPTAPAVPRRYSFYVECPSLPSTVGFSTTPFSDRIDATTSKAARRRVRTPNSDHSDHSDPMDDMNLMERCASRKACVPFCALCCACVTSDSLYSMYYKFM